MAEVDVEPGAVNPAELLPGPEQRQPARPVRPRNPDLARPGREDQPGDAAEPPRLENRDLVCPAVAYSEAIFWYEAYIN